MDRESRPTTTTKTRSIPKSTSRNAIPKGTVASRVRILQNLSMAADLTSHSAAVDSIKHNDPAILDLDTSRGSGQLTSASNSKVMRERRRRRSPHSFLGYKTPRINHGERHASCTADFSEEQPQSQGRVGFRHSLARSASARHPPGRLVPTNTTRIASCPVRKAKYHANREEYLPSLQGCDSAGSKTSNATTSTLRRQSVRELFLDYGVERPTGFASATDSSVVDEECENGFGQVCCHVCSFANKQVKIGCSKCGHRFCSACSTISGYRADCKTTGDVLPASPLKRLGPMQVVENRDSISVTDLRSNVPQRTVVASATSSLHKLALNQPARFNTDQYNASHTTSSGCADPSRKETHNGYEPCLHATPGSLHHPNSHKDSQYLLPEPIEGPVRNVDCGEDNPYFSKPHSRTSHTKGPTADNIPVVEGGFLSRGQKAQLNLKDYVICRGYPRTGHERCGSPIDSGIVGDCQHCINDCDCVACQSVPHAVRCCTNKEHSVVPHLHQAYKIKSKRSTLLSSSSESPRSMSLTARQRKPGNIVQNEASSTNLEKWGVKQNQAASGTVIASTLGNKDQQIVSLPTKGRYGKEQYHKNTARESCTMSFAELRAMKAQVSRSQNVPSRVMKERRISNVQAKTKSSRDSPQLPQRSFGPDGKYTNTAKSGRKDTHLVDGDGRSEMTLGRRAPKRMQQIDSLRQDEKSSVDTDDKLSVDAAYQFHYQKKKSRRNPSPLSLGSSHQDTGASETATSSTAQDPRADNKTEERISSHSHLLGSGKDILGITVIVHLTDREDMLFKVDASMALEDGSVRGKELSSMSQSAAFV